MSKLIRVNINLDNSHSLTDFPVDIYSGTTTGNTTNLVYMGVTTSPVTFTVDDSIMEFGLKLVSTGCLDQVLLIESPSVDCEICADFVEFFNPNPTPNATSDVTPQPTPNATPQPTPNATPDATPLPTNGSTPQPTPDATPVATPNATPLPTDGSTPQPTPDATPVATPNATPNATQIPTYTPIPSASPTPSVTPPPTEATCVCIEFSHISSGTRYYGYDDCSGVSQTGVTTNIETFSVCGNGQNITVSDGKIIYSIGSDCVGGLCPSPETTEISAILLCNTTSEPNNANCDEGNDGVLENRVFVLYNTTWFTTNASGKNVVKSTFSLTDNEIINGGDSSYTIHPDSIWTGGPSVFRNSSDGTYMISDNSTEGTEKLLFQKNGNFGTTNKCGGGPGGFN